MAIERVEKIIFHEQGTLNAVTRWIAGHPDGIAEWFKNVRRQYQVDRANVADENRTAVLLLQDARADKSARIGVLDVGGATLEDVTAWSTWQDPEASRRAAHLQEEETQGNGGKAYMYRLFDGPTRIFGVKDGRRNCKGFEGPPGTVDRGTPGWMPNAAEGRDVEISSWKAELREILTPYGLTFDDLPEPVRKALESQQAFTLVEGEKPSGLYKGRVDADDLVERLVRHEQSTLCLEQVAFYAIHNGRVLNKGKRLVLPAITPWPGLELPLVFEVPEKLPLENGQMISTTEGGTRERGRLVLHTSAENMPAAYKNLKPRWQITYRTKHQMIGAKPISEFFAANPAGAQYVYGTVELAALEPAYVEHGRRRPKPGPLVEALDQFISEKVREIAHQINAKRQQKLDEKALDQVHEENRKLNEFKNQFLPSGGEGDGAAGGEGNGPGGGGGGGADWGEVPDTLEHSAPEGGLCIGAGVAVPLRTLLKVNVRDARGRPVRAALEWTSSDPHVATISLSGELDAKEKGTCKIHVSVKGTEIEARPISIEVWNVDHVLLTPRSLEIPLGTRQQIIAEVTDDEGRRSTNALLKWRHDADDPLIVRVSQRGIVTANRLGRTGITAGTGEVWARLPVEVHVVPNPEKPKRGQGFPRLLLTGRDRDPATDTIREGDPDQPPLWQEPSDYVHNVWWLNLQNPEAAFNFRSRTENPTLWRSYHAGKIVDMVVQVWMTEEFTRKGEQQRAEFWADHLLALDRHRVRIVQQMWKRLEPYVIDGGLEADDEGQGSEIKGTGKSESRTDELEAAGALGGS
jgi:hypothetical protein